MDYQPRIALIVCIFFLVACASHSASQPPVSVEMQAMVATYAEPNGGRNPTYSPDGSRIAFLSSTLHTPADLWLMNADGTAKRRLTTAGVTRFRWSRDGRALVFVARRKGYEEVMSIPAEGGEEKRVAGLPPNASIPVTSPDGKLFAFTAPGAENIRDLWIGTSDGARLEAVTEKMSVRSVFFGPDSRKVYYEAGKSYGVGIWEMDLSSMQSKPLLSKYIGTPVLSESAGLVAYPYPTNPGQFDVHMMRLDGTKAENRQAPRLAERWLAWDAAGRGVYYLGQDIEPVTTEKKTAGKGPAGKSKPHESVESGVRRVGVTALWHLDFSAGGVETRVSPPELHVTDFSVSPDAESILLAGVLDASRTTEIFRLDLARSELTPVVTGRASAWAPIPSADATRIAFFTNEGRVDTLKVASSTGEEIASYPGLLLEADSRLFWLPKSEALLLFSGRGLHAFTAKGPLDFPNKDDFRTFLYADVSIQEDKILVSAMPRYGETPGLYQLEAVDNSLRLTDLRYPAPAEPAAKVYLQPRWSLDGKKIAFTDGVDVWTMRADGTGRARITRFAEQNEKSSEQPTVASFPAWSVGGDRICYTLTLYRGKSVARELWIAQADGAQVKRLFVEEIDSEFQVLQPEYTSPPFFDATDEHVIFTALLRGVPNIFVVSMKGADGARALTEQGGIFPALLPEEGVIVYTSLQDNDERLWMMSADGTDKRPFIVRPTGEKSDGQPAK